jgi:hypothetical protein
MAGDHLALLARAALAFRHGYPPPAECCALRGEGALAVLPSGRVDKGTALVLAGLWCFGPAWQDALRRMDLLPGGPWWDAYDLLLACLALDEERDEAAGVGQLPGACEDAEEESRP